MAASAAQPDTRPAEAAFYGKGGSEIKRGQADAGHIAVKIGTTFGTSAPALRPGDGCGGSAAGRRNHRFRRSSGLHPRKTPLTKHARCHL